METQIYIRGFPKTTTKDQLKDFFNDYSSIEGVRIIKDYAFIDFKQSQDADRAVRQKQGSQFQGKKLKVQIAGKPKKSRGPQPDDQCRYCGKLGHWKKQCNKFLKDRRRRKRSPSDDSYSSSESRRRRRRRSSRRRRDSYSSESSSDSSSSGSSDSSSSSSSESKSRSRQRSRKKNSKKY